ncbi:MAG TPA: glycolate oxidase subunit GlcF, partial [Xanthobacteraceae bacterium]
MRTSFTLAQLADPQLAECEKILRSCVHCGFCTATCPTYVLGGDERDSPRGRIYLIKDMIENDRPASTEVVTHIDRCLSCLACMTTCPSGVHYMHLVDYARARIERSYRRSLGERLTRAALAWLLPQNERLRWALRLARPLRPLAPLLGAIGAKPAAEMLRLAPRRVPEKVALGDGQVYRAAGERKGRVALMVGCVTPVIAPSILRAAIGVLTRHGIEVVLPKGQGCCGSIAHHLGREEEAQAAARRNVTAWSAELAMQGLDAILVTASGCGTTVKDYGFMLRTDSRFAQTGARVAAQAMDICEYLTRVALPIEAPTKPLIIAYHAACSLQHGQKITRAPKELLSRTGFVVKDIPEGHLCCGSAGTYNILQSNIAKMLRARKVSYIEKLEPDVVAAGNVGCITQIAAGTA